MRLAGDVHTWSGLLSGRVGKSGQSPDGMSLLTCTMTVVSDDV